jgi:hypothetical protein
LAWLALGVLVLSAAGGTFQAFAADLPDWYMHLGIWTVLLAYALLYINATNLNRPLRSVINYLLFTGLGLFWMRIMFTLIPAQPMLVDDKLVQRGALGGLAAVAGTLGLTMVLLLLHLVLFLVRRPRRQTPDSESPDHDTHP